MATWFMWRIRTASGAVAGQLVTKSRGEVVEVEHVGSAHTDAELALLLQVAPRAVFRVLDRCVERDYRDIVLKACLAQLRSGRGP